MKNSKVEQFIKEIRDFEPDEPEIAIVGNNKFIHSFSVLLTHSPNAQNHTSRESYAESLKKFGLEKDPQAPWTMIHSRVIPKMGTISYTVHFYSLAKVEIEIITDIGTKVLNSASATKSDIKKNVELAQSHLRMETKEVIKILNMIDDPKLKATYGAA